VRNLVIFLASAGYLGYAPVASGTWGTLAGIPAFWALDALGASAFVTVLLLAAFVLGACWIAGRAEKEFAEHDSGKIVIDEVAGFLATTLFLPFDWRTVIVAFFVFRALDVLKPWPAGWIDAKLEGGYGVVLDDVVSGLYSNVVTRIVLLLVWGGA